MSQKEMPAFMQVGQSCRGGEAEELRWNANTFCCSYGCSALQGTCKAVIDCQTQLWGGHPLLQNVRTKEG